MLTVITTCYNSEKTIERTIRSVLSQTDGQFEHIFIDGASKDNTVAIIEGFREQYAEKGIKMILVSEKDNGAYEAANKGLHLAKGDIIGYLNSDDWYEPNTVFLVRKTFEKNPGTDIVMGAMYIHNGDQIITKKPKKSFYVSSRNYNCPALFVTKDCYRDVGDPDERTVYADFDWYLRALKKGKKVVFLNDVLTNFLIGGISTQKSFRQIPDKIKERYAVYRDNGYSRFYIFECIFQELAKYCLIRA